MVVIACQLGNGASGMIEAEEQPFVEQCSAVRPVVFDQARIAFEVNSVPWSETIMEVRLGPASVRRAVSSACQFLP